MISIIIPTFDEASNLPATLDSIRANGGADIPIVVDASSRDDTVEVARTAGAVVLQSPQRQRASQMNLGAHSAPGDVFLFLHADTRLPPTALQQITTGLARSDVCGGAFARHYDSPSVCLRMTCLLADLRCQLWGWFLGDQAIFVRATTFAALGGFREMDHFEDLDFARRMHRMGRVVTLHPPVISSPRRFTDRGPLRTTARDFGLTMKYLFSGPPPSSAQVSAPVNRSAPALNGQHPVITRNRP